ncbi:mannose-1-phosphate guanylyltransferase/mannose-6-phosphate isomerase [Paradevosia shaoguanensis]|uniref:mannose-1-phosphate guanylyltransferase n=1 Tax=Paradevosia shaoguanensis TaxID=1335043 RepID=A0AA41QNH2_9HYPH|nr:mannose-1-phosphate guanylyltransferase/mannose-6-phosphate isomerase [Paradevosia shaoguanensis]MCF1742243.1 mannose-1-phosphate guanylyltransferase/mannose-6-phosphate isomerase [Paradevosia shaoguanensis]MCI0126726.1 mannose-1-phosphate guanylyltransferase/mannose-6-phosphate isomerase [Paradevosia shaoguanensis]
MAALILPVVLAGGQGTRLWPMSRSARPKQFLPLTGPTSLFQQTLQRVLDPSRYLPPIVLTNTEYRFLVAEQAQEAGVVLTAILLEPVARNTAAAIAAAAAYGTRTFGPGVVLHVLPSDHSVAVDDGYWIATDEAAAAANSGRLVTFGIKPTMPETGYGYIEAGKALSNTTMEVARFVEKPERARAEEMLASGRFYWNSGMFMLGAGTFLDECRRLAPETIAAAQSAVELAKADLDFVRLEAEAFGRAPDISVDYAIFEKTDRAAVLPVSFGWSDLGSWDAVWKVSNKDAAQNVANGPVTFSNTSRSLIVSERAHVAIEGLEDVAVIASEDAIYIGKLSEAQKVGPMVKTLRKSAATRSLTETHRTAYRPWGGYSSVLNGDRFQVKKLFVKPGRKLSLQKHHHRSEHWVVVRGTAEVTIDGTQQMLTENQSVYLPLGCTHRLANPGKIELELIEVQTGSYLGEDDIVRIEDDFGRQ